jgi:hypothetical protein
MENEPPPPGQCRICGKIFEKRQMAIHVRSCWNKHLTQVSAKQERSWFHLVVDTPYPSDYWLHLQAFSKSLFSDLDEALRRIWLECCDHLSAFHFPIKRPSRSRGVPPNVFALFDQLASAAPMTMADEDRLMGEPLDTKLSPGVRFSHDYDFGTTTTVALRVAGQYPAPASAATVDPRSNPDGSPEEANPNGGTGPDPLSGLGWEPPWLTGQDHSGHHLPP